MSISFSMSDGAHLNDLASKIHKANEKWWKDIKTGEPLNRNVGELLMLSVSELSEALEGHRKNLMDDKLPHRSMIEVELADCIIRVLDLAEGLNLNIGAALVEKCVFNLTRADHSVEERLKENGKKY